jgi:hypothetical protein
MAQVAVWDEVALLVVEVYQCLCASSISVDFLPCHLGQQGSREFDFSKPLAGVIR